MKAPKKPRPQSFAAEVGRALRRAGVAARRTARMHGSLSTCGRTARSSPKSPETREEAKNLAGA